MQAILRAICGYTQPDSSHPLSLFYHCDLAVVHQMTQLSQDMRGPSSNNLDRRSKLIKELKDSQHNLLLVLMHMVDTIIPELKQSRDFRVKYPDELTLDQTYGSIWFAAECLAAGSRIASHEYESIELKPYAVRLSKCITRIRQALREEEGNRSFKPTGKIRHLLRDFDKSWVDFEFRYVSAMCSVQTEMQLVHQQEIAVLFSEATHRALILKYFSHDQLEMMEPAVMFAIPRLAIISGLIVFPDGPINPQRPSIRIPACFRPYKQLLTKIKDLLSTLSKEDLTKLEEALCSTIGASSFEKTPSHSSSSDRHPITSPSPSTPSSPSSPQSDDEFPDRNLIFEPNPMITVVTDTTETGVENQNGSEDSTKENEHHEMAHNTSTSSPVPESSFDVLSQKMIIDSPMQQTLQLLTSSFTGSKDMLHKLFLAISEVADQLQTNFPRDYRAILKQVFIIYTGDEETDLVTHQTEPTRKETTSLFASIGFDLSISRRLHFSAAHKTKISEVEWVSDSQSLVCYVCEERFSLFRRKHHCRACGQVVCGGCSPHNLPLHQTSPKPERVCSSCYVEELGRIAKTLTTVH